MCHIFDFSACGHRDIDRSGCTNPSPVTDPCRPILVDWRLPGECSRCRKSYLRTVSRRSSIQAFEATRAALGLAPVCTSLFDWPELAVRKQKRPPRRGPLSHDHLPVIPESPMIVKEERSRNSGQRTLLPCQPTPADTGRVFHAQVDSTPAPAASYRVSYSPVRVGQTVQQQASLYAPLTISIPSQKVIAPPPQVISRPQPSVTAPPHLSSTPQLLARAPAAQVESATIPIVKSRPKLDYIGHQMKPQNGSARLRDASQGDEVSRTRAISPPIMNQKIYPSCPDWATLSLQIEERTTKAGKVWLKTQAHWAPRQTVHTPTQELFSTPGVKEIHPDQDGLSSCLRPADSSQAHNLSQISQHFNLVSETGRESSVECETSEPAVWTTTPPHIYTAYPGDLALMSAPEVHVQSYVAHEARETVHVEFVDRKHTAAPTPAAYIAYNPILQTSQCLVPAPVEDETATSHNDRSTTRETSPSELSASIDMSSASRRGQRIEVVNAYSVRDPAPPATTTTTPSQKQSLSELSPSCNRESQIEFESHSKPTTQAQHCSISVWSKRSNPLESAAEVVPETTMDSTRLHGLPIVRTHSAMQFGGTALDGVFENWSEAFRIDSQETRRRGGLV